MLKRIDACLYSCEATAEYYRNFGVSNKDLFFCPCAVDNDRFKSYADELLPRRLELRSQYGIPNDAVVFLFTGRLVSRKRPMDIIAAFEHLKSNYRSKAWMVFVGDGIEEKKLKDYSKRRNLKNVCFMGFRDQLEISKFYSLADVFVLSSDFDPSPKSLNEAMNFSLPVIASDMVGTAPDLVCEGKNGFIYPTGNVEILSEYMGQMLSSPEMVKKMGKFSLLRVSKWNYEEDVNGVLHALRHVVHY
jgi:glycosyltransferase involved in cell wall biosynthesis